MPEDSDAFDDFLGEEVVDFNGRPVGTLACYWEHEAGKTVLLGVEVEDHSTHVVPAKDVKLDARKSYVILPFSKDKLRKAPCLECGSELDRAFEQKVFAHYGDTAIDYKTSDAGGELRKKSLDQESHK